MYLPWPLPDDGWFADAWHQVDTEHHANPDDDDLRIAALVAQRLSIDWATRCQQITVTVQNRVVILAGLARTAEASQVAAELAWDVPGVYDVCNTIRVSQRRDRR